MVDIFIQGADCFDRDLHLLTLVQDRIPINWKDLIHTRETKDELKRQQLALDCLAICLSANEEDRVSVALEHQVKGQNWILIARDRCMGDQDEMDAEVVFTTLREATCAADPIKGWDILIARFPSLVRNKVNRLHEFCISRLRELEEEAAETFSDDSEPELLREQRRVDPADLNEIKTWTSKIIEAERIGYAIWKPFLKAMMDKLTAPVSLSSLRRDLNSIIELEGSLWILLDFFRGQRSFQHHLVDSSTTPLPTEQRVEGNYKPIDILKHLISPNEVDGLYRKALAILEKTINHATNKETNPAPTNEQTFFVSQTMHAEMRIILDSASRGTLASGLENDPSCIIGSSAGTCVCCALWIHFYNEQCGKAWAHKKCDGKVPTDWVAPLGDKYAISRKNLENIKQSVLNEIQRAMKTRFQKELNFLVSYGHAGMREVENALDRSDEGDEGDIEDEWVDE